jgi:hypothetical protein
MWRHSALLAHDGIPVEAIAERFGASVRGLDNASPRGRLSPALLNVAGNCQSATLVLHFPGAEGAQS